MQRQSKLDEKQLFMTFSKHADVKEKVEIIIEFTFKHKFQNMMNAKSNI